MRFRRDLARLIFAVVAAYVLVAQSALGGFADGRRAFGPDPFTVLCAQLADAEKAGHDRADMGSCCTLGCVAVAIAPATEPEVVSFAYPRPAPALRPDADDADPRPAPAGAVVRRPRGPPTVG